MNTMFNALRNCGLVENEDKKLDEYYPYEKFSDFRLPFGSCVGHKDEDVYYEHCKKSIDSINYMRKHAELLTLDQFNQMCPVLDKNDKTYKFLCKHVDKLKLVNEGSYHIVSNGIIGEHSSLDMKELERDVEYGFADVIFYVLFDIQYMRLTPHFDMGSINHHYQSEIRTELASKLNINRLYSFLDKEVALSAICLLLNKCEFIPLRISNYDGVRISHKAYRDDWGMKHYAVQSPALGLNIKKHDDIMKGLEGFISRGGKIFDNRLYLILESRNEKGTYYLRNYDKIKASDGE